MGPPGSAQGVPRLPEGNVSLPHREDLDGLSSSLDQEIQHLLHHDIHIYVLNSHLREINSDM